MSRIFKNLPPGVLTVPKFQETDDAQLLAKWMDRNRLVYLHCPNEGIYTDTMLARLQREGLKKGAPDYFIFSTTALAPRGAVIELKKTENSYPDAAQKRWIRVMQELGWNACVCYGWENAVDQLQAWRYGSPIG